MDSALDLLQAKRASQNGAFAVGEPLLEYLTAAEPVAPDGGGDIAPEGVSEVLRGGEPQTSREHMRSVVETMPAYHLGNAPVTIVL